MLLLSGGSTPLDSMPQWLQWVMQGSPSTHFVSLGAAILFRDAGLAVVWPDILALAVIGLVFFSVALARFRRSLAS
ncbi:Inner membrane transport permease YhhJ [compost metagenome]